MGTNYYIKRGDAECKHCGHVRPSLHIGKSSMGWPFLFRGYRDSLPEGLAQEIVSARDWVELMTDWSVRCDARIFDEYGHEVALPQFWELVHNKRGETAGPSVDRSFGSRRSEWYDAEGNRFCDNEFC